MDPITREKLAETLGEVKEAYRQRVGKQGPEGELIAAAVFALATVLVDVRESIDRAGTALESLDQLLRHRL